MWNGYYTAASGMLSTIRMLDVVSNNLANITTPSYKKDKVRVETVKFKSPGAEAESFDTILNRQARVGGVSIDFEPGSIKTTSRKLDLAILNPSGFFAIKTPKGIRYTRDGEFFLNSKGVLVNKNGFEVMSKSNKSIIIPGNKGESNLGFSENGDVYVDQVLLATIKIVDFNDKTKLMKEGNSMFYMSDPAQKEITVQDPQVRSGALERSNVSIADAMVDMIKITRMYEFQQRVMDTILTDIAKKTTDEVGRP